MKAKVRQVGALLLLVGALALSGCATPNPNVGLEDRYGNRPGLLFGFWHGLTAPFSLIGSALTDRVFTIYEVRNSGTPYEAGFLLGFTFFLGGAALVFTADQQPGKFKVRPRNEVPQRGPPLRRA